jgi:hypothetical protein
MVLRGACPNCLHNNAFEHIVLSAVSSIPRGSSFDTGSRELDFVYPQDWLVECRCGDPSHGGAGGCQRRGYIDTAATLPS